MSIRRNIAANYVGQLYAALIGILLVPLYVGYMGVEAYGLVGFYTMLQGWFMLLDMGLTPTLGREAARFNGGAISALDLRRLLRSFEGVFAVLGIVGALVLIAGAGHVADGWLKLQQLDAAEVQRAAMLMAAIVALRWICGLYRSALTGFERIVWLSGFSVVVATLRFVLVIPFLVHVGATPTHFFSYQLAVAVIEVGLLIVKTYRVLPPKPDTDPIRWQWQPLRGVAGFALSGAFVTVLWVLVTQTDKMLLSGMIPLTDYGYYTLAVLAASGIVVLSNPIIGATLPRLVKLHANGDESGFVQLYRDATQLVTAIVVPAVLLLALFAEQVLIAWTGSLDLARAAAPLLALYAIGNGLLTLAGFPYQLQVARGSLRLHVIGNVIFVLLFVPLLLFAVPRFGAIGAGYAWIAANLLPFALWTPLVHSQHLRGVHRGWLKTDIGAVAALPILAAGLMVQVVSWPSARPALFVALLLAFLLLSLLAMLGSSTLRNRLLSRARARFI